MTDFIFIAIYILSIVGVKLAQDYNDKRETGIPISEIPGANGIRLLILICPLFNTVFLIFWGIAEIKKLKL